MGGTRHNDARVATSAKDPHVDIKAIVALGLSRVEVRGASVRKISSAPHARLGCIHLQSPSIWCGSLPAHPH